MDTLFCLQEATLYVEYDFNMSVTFSGSYKLRGNWCLLLDLNISKAIYKLVC